MIRRRLKPAALAALGATVTIPFTTAPVLAQTVSAPLWSISMLVRTAEGTPAANANIRLTVLPRGGIPKGTPDHVIATTMAGTDGTFTIPAPTLDAWSLQQAAVNGGWLNMQIDASAVTIPNTTHVIGSTEGTVLERASTALAVLVTDGSATEAKVGTVKMLANPVTLIVDQTPGQAAATVDGTKEAIISLTQKLSCPNCLLGPQPANQCNPYGNWYNISGNGEVDWAPVGEYHTVDDMTGRFDYGQSASTNLGVGYNFSDGNGWQVSGSVYIGNSNNQSNSSGYNEGAWYSQEIDAQFHYVEEEADPSGCTPEPGPEYRVRSDYWTAGMSDTVGNGEPGDGQANYCSVPAGYYADFNPGGNTDSINSSGWTYTWDVSAYGVTLSSETDYSQQEHLHWDFGTVSGTEEWHSVFSFYGPLTSDHYLVMNASTEPYGQRC